MPPLSATGRRNSSVGASLPRLSREANDLGRINIQDGTKGGRAGASAPRWTVVDEYIRVALTFAAHVLQTGIVSSFLCCRLVLYIVDRDEVGASLWQFINRHQPGSLGEKSWLFFKSITFGGFAGVVGNFLTTAIVLLLLFGAAMAAGAAWLLERFNREPTDDEIASRRLWES